MSIDVSWGRHIDYTPTGIPIIAVAGSPLEVVVDMTFDPGTCVLTAVRKCVRVVTLPDRECTNPATGTHLGPGEIDL